MYTTKNGYRNKNVSRELIEKISKPYVPGSAAGKAKDWIPEHTHSFTPAPAIAAQPRSVDWRNIVKGIDKNLFTPRSSTGINTRPVTGVSILPTNSPQPSAVIRNDPPLFDSQIKQRVCATCGRPY